MIRFWLTTPDSSGLTCKITKQNKHTKYNIYHLSCCRAGLYSTSNSCTAERSRSVLFVLVIEIMNEIVAFVFKSHETGAELGWNRRHKEHTRARSTRIALMNEVVLWARTLFENKFSVKIYSFIMNLNAA